MRKRSVAMSFFCKLVLLGAVAQCAFVVSAKTIYVAPSGDDTAAGTSDAPVATIKKGIALATEAGDIVSIADGDYEIGAQITVSKAITIQGNVIDCSKVMVNCKGVSQALYSNTVDGFSIEGVSFTNINKAVYAAKAFTLRHCTFRKASTNAGTTGPALYIKSGSAGVTSLVEDCVFDDVAGKDRGAVHLDGGTYPLVFRRCVFSNCSASNNGGAVGQNSNGGIALTMENCQFLNCQSAAGGAVFQQENSGTVTTFRNCLFADNSTKGTAGYGGAAYFTKQPTLCENCTFVNNTSPSGSYPIARNNSKSTFVNCLFWNNKVGDEESTSKTANSFTATNCAAVVALATGNGNVALDASPFAAQGVYTLAPTVGVEANPCIDGGTTLDWMAGAKDLAGADRIVNGVPDIGAYEYGGVVKLPAGYLMYLD